MKLRRALKPMLGPLMGCWACATSLYVGAAVLPAAVWHAAPAQEVGPRVEPVEAVPFDLIGGDGIYRARSTTSSASGSICLVNPSDQRIMVLDENLRLVTEFGQEGSGPGEMRQPTSCAIDGAGRILVLDTVLGRLSVFDASGEVLETHPTGRSSLGSVLGSDGTIADVARDFAALTLRAPRAAERRIDLAVDEFNEPDRGRVYTGVSFDGRQAVSVPDGVCGNADSVTAAWIDLDSNRVTVREVTVYGEFRERRGPMGPAKGIRRVLVLRRPAIDATRAYFLHSYTRNIYETYLTPLDVWDTSADTLTRIYVSQPGDRFERPRLISIAATPSGDLLILDVSNELVLRLRASQISDAVASGR